VAQPTIPGYSIVERIGSGGFASVYLATHDETEQNVAIKVLHDHTSNGADLTRFERERTTMRALNGHPNIVAIFDAGTTDDERHFTVLEYVGGGSVRDRIVQGGALQWANVVEIGVQICAALNVAHRSGVLHRDVKPANILLEENIAKLSDFGIARLIGQSQVTAAQSIIGTLAYTPPEVFHNKPFDGRGDIYQLGISLYEMLLGRAPFTSAAADNKAMIIRRILDNPAPPLAQFDVPLPLSDLLDEVLAKDPADRPQTAETFGRRLNEVEQALGRTPTSIGDETESLSLETATILDTGETGEHDQSVWPASADSPTVAASTEVAQGAPVAEVAKQEEVVVEQRPAVRRKPHRCRTATHERDDHPAHDAPQRGANVARYAWTRACTLRRPTTSTQARPNTDRYEIEAETLAMGATAHRASRRRSSRSGSGSVERRVGRPR